MKRALPLLLLAACVAQRGESWTRATPEAATTDETPASLILLSNSTFPGRTAEQTAARLERVLHNEREMSREPVVLWLGNNSPPPRGREPCTGETGVHALQAAIENYKATSFAVAGFDEWRCGLGPIGEAPYPGQRPGAQYVVRLSKSDPPSVVSECTAATCTLKPESDDALADLVVVDVAPWIDPAPVSTRAAKAGDESLAMLEHLINALRESSNTTPRLLVAHVPVEAAGFFGSGGGHPDSTFHTLPASLQSALSDGLFSGVLAGRDRGLYASADLFDAVKRSERAWLSAPLFQVVSGTTTRTAAGKHRLRYFTSSAIKPELWTHLPGFAVVRITSDAEADIELHARRGGQWQTGTLRAPLQPSPHANRTASPQMAPCRDCPIVPVSDRQ